MNDKKGLDFKHKEVINISDGKRLGFVQDVTADFKTGMTIIYNGDPCVILDFQHVKPGKGQAFVRTKLRNFRTGSTIDYSFNAGVKVEQALIEKHKMQYSYSIY